ncbi:MAG: cytochrome c4 [Burkholderiales bacterium]|jgi:cytochrome c553|nr:cytochrome c4 [Burkholderiales bacterium]
MNKATVAAALALAAGIAAAQTPAPDLERAKKIANGGCVLCHGADGESSSELFPKLAAQNANYLAKQLANFKSGARKSTTMQPMVKDLSEADFASLGAYYAAKPASAHDVSDADLAGVGRYMYAKGNRYSGVPACAGCHGPDGGGTAALPRLAGQHALYVENQIKQFNKRERTTDNEVMHTVAAKMTELEVKAVAEYLAGKK